VLREKLRLIPVMEIPFPKMHAKIMIRSGAAKMRIRAPGNRIRIHTLLERVKLQIGEIRKRNGRTAEISLSI
jgi:hypothetical protein